MKPDKKGNLKLEAPAPKPVTYPIPEIAKSAAMLAEQNFRNQINQLGLQTVQSLGLDPKAYDYSCDFSTGLVTRGRKLEPEA